MINKCFDDYERQLCEDLVTVRFPEGLSGEQVFR